MKKERLKNSKKSMNMKIKNNYYLTGSVVLLLIAGCGQPAKEEKKQETGFKTNMSGFINTLDNSSPNKKNRNALMDEFIIKSDVQCQHYLEVPLTKPKKEDGMAMKVYDATGQAFGVKNITDGAKTLYTGGDKDKNKEANSGYEKVLFPEIKRGVELAREKYARTNMYSKKYKLIESYTNKMLERDMQNYDKMCNHEVGLIEINKALKKMQKRPKKVSPFSPKLVIDPVTTKNKVETATKEVEVKDEEVEVKKEEVIAGEKTETILSSEPEDLNETSDPSF